MSKKRAFVKYTKAGKLVPGTLIITDGAYPDKNAKWKEIPYDLCCESLDNNSTTTSTSTSTSTTSTSTSTTTSTTTVVDQICCTPSITWNSAGSGDGGSQLDFSYAPGSNCLSCTNLKLQYSTDNVNFTDYSPLFNCNSTGVFFMWTTAGIPWNSTYYVRLITICNQVESTPSASVSVTAF
ncbi:MAG: hypothetical protein ACK518_03745 [bacterium]|jgi:hypothetical protein